MAHEDVRAELLDHHARLRIKIARGRELANQAKIRELHDALIDLSNLLRLHHSREEEVLRAIFPQLDDWGMLRAASMVEEHADEHREIFDTLLLLTTSDTANALATAIALFDRILAHMADERPFLEPDE